MTTPHRVLTILSMIVTLLVIYLLWRWMKYGLPSGWLGWLLVVAAGVWLLLKARELRATVIIIVASLLLFAGSVRADDNDVRPEPGTSIQPGDCCVYASDGDKR